MDAETIIALDSLNKQFGQQKAVDHINLEIKHGEFLSILGPSGCGKTTTLRMIAGFEQPTSGKISIDGKSAEKLPAHKRPINTVFQDYALFPHLTIYQNIAFGLKRKKMPKSEIQIEVNKVLDMMGLDEHQDKYPKQLSGGQQQRVALARALVNKPKVLLLDEPLGALDLKLRKKMQYELKQLHEKVGITFVYVTHDQEEALVMSDRIAVMNKGKIEQVGTPKEIYNQPNTSYVADFIGEANILHTSKEINNDGYVNFLGYKFNIDEPNQNYYLIVRPERIRISKEKRDKYDIQIKSTIENITYAGSKSIMVTRVNDVQIIVHYDESETSNLKIGEQVYLSWNRDECRIISNLSVI